MEERPRHQTRILLAGPVLREAKSITWPESEMTMSLVGFEHVFRRAVPNAVAADLTLDVVPAVVLALLKMTAFLDDMHRRQKDLLDIRDILDLYAARYRAGVLRRGLRCESARRFPCAGILTRYGSQVDLRGERTGFA
jgi:hypothetical protein